MDTARPEVVTLCGSARFRAAFEGEQRRLTLEGRIVISLGFFDRAEGSDVSSTLEAHLGQLHLRKIDLSQGIHVMNVGGYIGASTRREIDYAHRHGVAVTYMEP